MINEQISERILTVCPEYSKPKGGVSQCVATYDKVVYKKFKTVCNSCSGSIMKKLICMVKAILQIIFILLYDHKIRIVHIHTASYNSFRRSSIFVRISKRLGRKVVLHIHGGGFKEYYALKSAFVDNVFSKCDSLAVLSASWKEFFDSIVTPDKVYVVPNIIENPQNVEVAKDGKVHFLFLGQICQAKGIFDLVETLSEHKIEFAGKLILDVGGGMHEEERLKCYVSTHNLGDIIRLHGWVSGNDKIRLLNLADVFILPSYVEGVPISIIEAEAYGMPILSTPVGGIPEVVKDGENGFLFVPGNRSDMKTAIDSVISDADLRSKMGEKSRIMVKDNMPENVIAVLSALYEKLLVA